MTEVRTTFAGRSLDEAYRLAQVAEMSGIVCRVADTRVEILGAGEHEATGDAMLIGNRTPATKPIETPAGNEEWPDPKW